MRKTHFILAALLAAPLAACGQSGGEVAETEAGEAAAGGGGRGMRVVRDTAGLDSVFNDARNEARVAFGALVFALSRDAGRCPKAGRPRFGFPCDGSHASRPSSRHALLTVVSGMPRQSRSSRLQRGSPR